MKEEIKDITPKELYNLLPKVVRRVLLVSDGWLVGGAINKLLTGEEARDYDIVVDSGKWAETVALLDTGYSTTKEGITINTFGGLKVTFDGFVLDVWPQTLNEFLQEASSISYIYNLRGQKLLKLQ